MAARLLGRTSAPAIRAKRLSVSAQAATVLGDFPLYLTALDVEINQPLKAALFMAVTAACWRHRSPIALLYPKNLNLKTGDGLRYRLEDGREFKSPSSGVSAVMGGKACNGWKFWSIAEAASPKVKTSKGATEAGEARSPRSGRYRACSEGAPEPE